MRLQTLDGFDEAVRRHTWAGETLPAVWKGHRPCNRCSVGEIVRVGTFTQTALFYHGGYGAAERKTVDICLACGRVNIDLLETLNPRRFT